MGKFQISAISAKRHRFDTKYYYKVGIVHSLLTFWFIIPPVVGPDVPYTFGLIGDLGQSYDSNQTLNHYELNPKKGKDVLFVGDLSYVDNYPNHDNTRKTAFTTCLTILGIKFACYVYGRQWTKL